MNIFTLNEADELLPKIKPIIEDLFEKQGRILRLEAEIESIHILRTNAQEEGAQLSEDLAKTYEQYQIIKQERDRLIQTIQTTGVILKCYHLGIVDFPVSYEGKLIFLCWRVGEPKIEFWHEYKPQDVDVLRKPIEHLFER